MIFLVIIGLKSPLHICFFMLLLNKVIILQKFRSYLDSRVVVVLLRCLVCRRFVTPWCFSSFCCDALFVWMQFTRQSKFDYIKFMVVNVLKN